MAGQVVVNREENRIYSMSGTLTSDVKFGFGILGRLRKGGHLPGGAPRGVPRPLADDRHARPPDRQGALLQNHRLPGRRAARRLQALSRQNSCTGQPASSTQLAATIAAWQKLTAPATPRFDTVDVLRGRIHPLRHPPATAGSVSFAATGFRVNRELPLAGCSRLNCCPAMEATGLLSSSPISGFLITYTSRCSRFGSLAAM